MEPDSRNLHLVDHVTARLKVFIQPAYAKQVELGVKKELDTHVLRYMEDQQAVLLGYRNVKVVSKQALLTAYMPYLTIDCTAELVLFRPNIGNVLVGRVHSLSPGQLNVLVLGGINACVTEGELPEGFRYDMDYNCWVRHGDYSRAILMGDIVACKVLSAPVTDIDQEQLLFNLDATLLSKSTGLLQQQPPIQQQRRAELQAAVASEAASAGAAAASKAARREEKAVAKAARKQEKEAARAARKAEKAAAKEAARAQKKAAKRKQPEAAAAEAAAGQPPAKRQKHSEQQQPPQQVQQKQHNVGQLPQPGSTPAAGGSSSEQSPAQAQPQQQPGGKSSKHKHKDKSGAKSKHKDKQKSSSKQKPVA